MANDLNVLLGKFIGELTNVNSIEQTFTAIEREANPILAEFGVAKWSFHYFAPSDIAFSESVEQNKEFVISDEEYDEADTIKKEYSTPNQGSLSFTIFHIKGKEWKERNDLNTIMDLIYVALGRGRVYSSYDIANTTDPITGANNRLALTRFMEKTKAMGKSQNYTSAFMNIKNFKWINDKYGSGAGDKYLKAFTTKMKSIIDEDEFFARLGGDNFVLVVKNENVDFIDDRLRHIEFDVVLNGEKQSFTTKLRAGIYALREGDGMHEIMQAMAAALQYSRMPDTTDFVWYQQFMDERDKKLRAVQDAFPDGLKKNEFVPYYQPKIRLTDNKMCGAEALCRWKKGDEFVPPMEFIPTLEMDGSVVKLDFYMLDKVCRDIAEMTKAGLNPGKISVNFSKHHIHNKNLCNRIIATIDRHGVDHSNIEIELTEMYAYDDYEDVHNFIKEMSDAGISISLDDFGTGYSSLNMLTGLDADIVKLDKSFMDDIEEKPEKHSSMVKNIINMINELGMETLAEGVETKGQCKMLKNWNCATVQGFLFDRPLPLEEFKKRILNPNYEI